ncbi:hypothetical protein NKG05_28525 [Oerskovia sp. M15]
MVAALRTGLEREGLDVLPWRESARELRHRLTFLHGALGARGPTSPTRRCSRASTPGSDRTLPGSGPPPTSSASM